MELLEKEPTHAESTAYIQFMEEIGAEYLGSAMRWVYFKKKSELGKFDIYSDLDSRIKHLNRILTLLGVLMGINAFNAINMLLLQKAQLLNAVGFFVTAIVALLAFGFARISRKKTKLQKEKKLFE